MDVQLDLPMWTAGILEGWSLTDYQSEYKEILQTPSTGLELRVIDGCYGFEQQQRSGRASRNRSRNRIPACEYI